MSTYKTQAFLSTKAAGIAVLCLLLSSLSAARALSGEDDQESSGTPDIDLTTTAIPETTETTTFSRRAQTTTLTDSFTTDTQATTTSSITTAESTTIARSFTTTRTDSRSAATDSTTDSPLEDPTDSTVSTSETESPPTVVTVQPPTEEPTAVIDDRCTRPPNVGALMAEYTDQVSSESLFVTEGRCYIACVEFVHGDGYQNAFTDNTGYQPWPYYTLGETCLIYQYNVHECIRGCVRNQNTQASGRCNSGCKDECREECNGDLDCANPDPNELWVNPTCDVRCSSSRCTDGCLVNLDCSDCSPPLAPIAPPTLIPVEESKTAGLYTIDLSESVPESSQMTSTVSFLFEVYDHTTSNYSYQWVIDPPNSQLHLANFACREVSVRFAVVGKGGQSMYSGSTRIPQVYGDPTRRPNAAMNVQVANEIDDTRVGYFGHVVLTVTWDHPHDQLHLDGYSVEVYHSPTQPATDRERCGQGTWSTVIHSTNTTRVTVKAETPDEVPVMNCFYDIEVHALGADDNTTATATFLTGIFPSEPRASFIENLQCNKIWDPVDFKFSLNFTWSLPFHIAHEDAIDRYLVDVSLAHGDSFIQETWAVGPHYEYVPSNQRANETEFYFYLPYDHRDFFLPQLESENLLFYFRLFFHFNESKVRFPYTSGALPTRTFTCTTDTISPPPFPVQNFNMSSYNITRIDRVAVNLTWTQPATANGRLGNYSVCTSDRPLENSENVPENVCKEIESTLTEANVELSFLRGEESYCLYIQMRPSNEFVSGNWSEPVIIYLGLEGSCTEPAPVTTPSVVIEADRTELTIGLAVILPVIVLLCVAICLCALLFCLRRRKMKWRVSHTETPSDLDSMFSAGPRRTLLPQTSCRDAGLPDEWEITPSQVIMAESLGEGAFGEVYKGVITGPLRCTKVMPSLRNAIGVPVAIKLLKISAQGSERADFLSEIDMMKMISEGQNPNVIGLVGCVTVQEPLSLILELVPYGDLLSYLRTNMRINAGHEIGDHDNAYHELGVIETVDLVKFSYQIASGMEYLSSLGVIHRDLACRNILVDEGKVLKITDFGMSREVEEIYVQKRGGRVPLKWMALESILTREFTTASDVWSYGVCLWEIGTMGGFPYPTISNDDLILHLKSGYRMDKPDNCSPEIYEIMLSCWEGDPSKRPTFRELKAKFDRMLRSNADYIYFLPNNSDNACYRPENAPEETLNVPATQNQTASPMAANRMSLSAYHDARHTTEAQGYQFMQPAGPALGRSTGQNSPSEQSPRSVSPAYDLSPLHPPTTNTAQRSASMLHPRDSTKGKRLRVGNVYVDDPAKKLKVNQARPNSMLVSREDAPTADAATPMTLSASPGMEPRPRPNSVFVPGKGATAGKNGGVPGYVNVPNGGKARNGGVTIKGTNPLFEMQAMNGDSPTIDTPSVQENGIHAPGIQIKVTRDST